MGSAKNPIAIDEDEGFSETMPQNSPPQQSQQLHRKGPHYRQLFD